MDTFFACVDPCGGQDATSQQFRDNPTWKQCQDDCQKEVTICYAKIITVTKDEYERLIKN